MALFTIGAYLLILIPVIESFNRQAGIGALFAVSVLIAAATFPKNKIRFDYLNLIFMAFVIWSLFISFFSISYSRSFGETLRYAAYFLIFLSVREARAGNKIFINRYFKLYVLLNSAVLSILFIIFALIPGNFSEGLKGMNLFYPVFGHNRLSSLLIITLPLLLASGLGMPGRKYGFWNSLAVSIFMLLLLLTFGRGEWLSVSAILILFCFLDADFRSKYLKRIIAFAATALILATAIFIYSHFINPKTGNGPLKGTYKPLIREKRMEYLKQAWEGIKLSPITGSGLDTFRYISKRFQTSPFSWSWYAHNHFVQIFTETGVPGGIIFTLLFALLLRSAFHPKKIAVAENRLILISILPSFLHVQMDYDWQFIGVFLIVIWGIALLAGPVKQGHEIRGRVITFPAAIIFLIWITGNYDSDRIIARQTGTEYLEFAARMDAGYNEISKKLAYEYQYRDDYAKAHFWYRRAILQDPLESEIQIRDDYLLYLKEADSTENRIPIDRANSIYPIYRLKSGLEFTGRENIGDYMAEMEKFAYSIRLRQNEIKNIVKNEYFIN